MRAGRLQTRRYRVRKIRRRVLILLILLLGAGAYLAVRSGALPVPSLIALRPAATLSPEETAARERVLSLPGGHWYALETGTYESAASASQAAESLRGRGGAGYVPPGTGQVLAAAYPSRADAQKVQTQLKENHGMDTAQAEILWPEIHLKIAGQKTQLDAMADGCAALYQLPEQLYALSSGLDQRTLEPAAAREALASQRSTLTSLCAALDARFDRSAPEAVGRLKRALSSLSDALLSAQGASGSVRLGGQIKYCQLAALCLCRDISGLLSGQLTD